MLISELLSPDSVRVTPAVSSKKRLFNALGEFAEEVHDLEGDRVSDALMEREKLGPTGVGHGVALPHARLDNIPRVRGLFLKLERPVDFGSVDRQPVDLIFCLLAASDAGVDHLKALATVSRTLRDPDLCAKLRANDHAQTLHAVLTDRSVSTAA